MHVYVPSVQTPGTLAYMPPEALEEEPKYSSTLDIFSFGHLALYTIVQDFPFPTSATYSDRRNPKILVARSELERRARHMEKLCTQLGKKHPLGQLVTQCLQNDQGQRPTARWLLRQLEGMRAEVQGPYESMSRLELIVALRDKEGHMSSRSSQTLRAQVGQLQVIILCMCVSACVCACVYVCVWVGGGGGGYFHASWQTPQPER